jgi:hypothetical protein
LTRKVFIFYVNPEKMNTVSLLRLVHMGVYTTYEVFFLEEMTWDDLEVKEALRNYICKFMYIYDIQENIVILSVYSTSPLERVLGALEQLYGKLKYRAYMAQEGGWICDGE